MNDSRPNIVLVTIDALRAKNLGCLGYSRNTAPHLDGLAERGILYSKAFSNGPTTPFSFPSIMTSVYPLMLSDIGLPESGLRTIAEVLKEQGYATAAWHPNPFISSAYNYDRGFDVFKDPESWSSQKERVRLGVTRHTKKWPKIHRFARSINNKLFRRTFSFAQKTAGQIVDAASSWIAERHQPYFVWMHFNDTHHPWYPKKNYLGRFRSKSLSPKKAKKLVDKLKKNPDNIWENIRPGEMADIIDLYDSEIAYTDDMLGRFFDSAVDLKNTVVFVTSDHGEEFGEHGGFHRNKPYDEMIHVPLIIAGGDLPQGQKIDAQLPLIDLPPTILEVCGIPKPPEFLGSSLTHRVDEEHKERAVYVEYNRRLLDGENYEGETLALRKNGWKYIKRESGEELYHLETDPGEKINLLHQEPDTAREMRSELDDHILFLNENRIDVARVELDEKLKQTLKGLGYID